MLFEPYNQEHRLLLYFWREWSHNVQFNKYVYIGITANMTVTSLQAAFPQIALEVTEFQRIIVFYE